MPQQETGPDQETDRQAGPVATPSMPSPTGYSNHAIHLVRTVQTNTLALSHMADQKASILMGATFLVFSLSVSRAIAGPVPWSLMILAGFSFLSALCAVLAIMPSIRPAHATQGGGNLLFFGHFGTIAEADWTEQMLESLKGDETAFRLMLHDIYQNGQVLQRRKYRYLAIAYRLFMLGLPVTAIAFGLEKFLLA